MKKIKILLGSLLAITHLIANGQLQNSNFSAGNADLDASGRNPTLDFIFQQYRNSKPIDNGLQFEGSPFFSEEFIKASIFIDGELETSTYARYDGYNDEIQLKNSMIDEKVLSLLRRENISCDINGVNYGFKQFLDKKGNLKTGYLIVLVESKDYTLYQRKRKIFKEGKEAKTSLELDVPNRFVESMELFVGSKTSEKETISYLKQNKKEVLKLFSDGAKFKSVKDFVTERNLNLRLEKDIEQLFIYYGTIE